ncbi:MAG: DNA modification methylase [Alphaproteobacteria bacterium]|nr:DNA modification methylase [Alphaproteobacteria bacterium]
MTKFSFNDLISLYQEYEKQYGDGAYKYISKLLEEAKPQHKATFTGQDHEQSWRGFKGRNLEKLIRYIIEKQLQNLGLKMIDGDLLKHKKENNPDLTFAKIKRNLLVCYGEYSEYGYYMPDVDIVTYNPENFAVVAVLSIKATPKKQIAQNEYWKLKLQTQKFTKHIKFCCITLDEDGALKTKKPIKKARAIVETDLHGSYVISENNIEESNHVKLFDKFIDDLKAQLP